MTECGEIIIFIDNVSTKKTNTIATKVTNTALLSCHSIKVRDCYILRTVLLAIILLLIIVIVCCHYAKQKRYNIKRKIMNLKKFVLKIARVTILKIWKIFLLIIFQSMQNHTKIF